MRSGGLILNVVLLLVVAGEVLFLSTRYRQRVDLTSDNIYSLSASTHALIERLESPLHIEAYFTSDEKLPAYWRDGRQVLNDFLDELVQNSGGMIRVDYIDPASDPAIRRRALRLRVRPEQVRQLDTAQSSLTETWQGLRLRHETRQDVVPLVTPGSCSPGLLELILTPAMKRVTTESVTNIAYMSWPVRYPPTRAGERPVDHGFRLVRNQESLKGRVQWYDVTDTRGVLVPDNIDHLVIFRPHALTERQRYVIDQFLMRGGQLVLFLDAHDFRYRLAATQSFQPLARFTSIDAPGTTRDRSFLKQLESYGVTARSTVLSDAKGEAHELFGPYIPSKEGGGQILPNRTSPYLFRPLNVNWADRAREIAKVGAQVVDEQLVKSYAETFGRGINPDHPLNRRYLEFRSPGFYFPTPLEVGDLPTGVEATVVMQTSPFVGEEAVGVPLGWFGANPSVWTQDYTQRFQQYMQMVMPSLRRQVPLVVDLEGSFPSFFRGREIPLRPGQKKPTDPLDEPVKESGEIGPLPQAGPDDRDKDADPAMVETAPATARLLVIGDTDFVRDDLVRGDYGGGNVRPGPGPISLVGPAFFLDVIEYLIQDQELQKLRSRGLVDRTLSFVEKDLTSEGSEVYRRRQEGRILAWQIVNVALPIAGLLGLALALWLVRLRQKRAFLASTQQLGEQI